MRVTAIQIQAEQKRQDKSVRRAGKTHRRARMMRICSLIDPTPNVSTIADINQGEKGLLSRQI